MTANEVADDRRWLRRAKPLLGTLVEVGVCDDGPHGDLAATAAFESMMLVQARMSKFEPGSDVSRFHRLRPGESMDVDVHTAAVLVAARQLHHETGGSFDITLHSATDGWRFDNQRLHRMDDTAHIDLGGIAKGYAVDLAVRTLIELGCTSGWVNAGGDLRVFGVAKLPLLLRDERGGGVRPFAQLQDGAFATSHFSATSRCAASRGACEKASVKAHVSVAAPLCLWADALTKVVALSGDTEHPVLSRYHARAWLH